MKRLLGFSLAILGLLLVISFCPLQAQEMKMKGETSQAEQLRLAMHKLWEDHVTWTRNVILNIIDDLPGTDQAVSRLLQNPG